MQLGNGCCWEVQLGTKDFSRVLKAWGRLLEGMRSSKGEKEKAAALT